MKIQKYDQKQLGLNLPNHTPIAKCPSHSRARQRRMRRAGLWFNHMRQIVDRAPDPVPAPEPNEFSRAA